MHCASLYFTVLLNAALHYSAPHYSALHYSTLHYPALHFSALQYSALHYSALNYSALHYPALHNSALHYSALHNSALHYSALQSILLHFKMLDSLASNKTATTAETIIKRSKKKNTIPDPDIPSPHIEISVGDHPWPGYGARATLVRSCQLLMSLSAIRPQRSGLSNEA